MIYEKIRVEVNTMLTRSGEIRPVSLVWKNGRRIPIEQVLKVSWGQLGLCGIVGRRYTCRILGETGDLYYEDATGLWYIERACKDRGRIRSA